MADSHIGGLGTATSADWVLVEESGVAKKIAPSGLSAEQGSMFCGMDNRTQFALQYGDDEGYDEEFDGYNIADDTLPSGWITVNKGSSVYRQNNGMGRMDWGGGGSLYNIHCALMPFEADSWTAWAHMTMQAENTGNTYLGHIVLYNSSNSRVVTVGAYNPAGEEYTQWYVTYQSTAGAGSSTTIATGPAVRPWGAHAIVRITKNSDSSYDFHVNYDGGCWFQIAAGLNIASASYLNGNPDHIGFGTNSPYPSHTGLEWLRIRDVVGYSL